jgi:DNA transposition AAA+ family ATPase
MLTTNPAQIIATELGEITPHNDQLQQEITRLRSPTIVFLGHVLDLHNWLDEKRKARQSCRLLGESRTGKTIACDSYKLRNKRIQKGQGTPKVPVVYIMPPTKCGAKELFQEIIEALRYRAVKGTVSDFRSRAMDVLKACDVEMLIIDEAESVFEK